MAAERLFIDTWGWLVLANRQDPAFESVVSLRASTGKAGSWITTDYVLDETITRLFAGLPFGQARRFVEGLFESSREGTLDIEVITPERFTNAWKLRMRYQDKPRISFTDLTSFTVMHELKIQRVLTGDAHFEQVGMGFMCLP